MNYDKTGKPARNHRLTPSENVANPDSNYSGQCATGAQYAAGTVVNGQIHDAPSTSTWSQDASVAGNSMLSQGSMIAYGWDSDGNYPNATSGNHTALYRSQTETTITVDEQFMSNGKPTGFKERVYDKSDFDWNVVTTSEKYDPNVTQSYLEPIE